MNNQSQAGGPGTTLETAIIFTTDMETLANFYKEGLDLGDFERSPGHIGMKLGSVYLGFDQVEEVPSGGPVTLWFTVEDIESTYKRLLDMGAEDISSPSKKPWGGFLAAVYDPEGNMIGLSQREA
jgi:predicted enzyme related to lactoylglutathione lyase